MVLVNFVEQKSPLFILSHCWTPLQHQENLVRISRIDYDQL